MERTQQRAPGVRKMRNLLTDFLMRLGRQNHATIVLLCIQQHRLPTHAWTSWISPPDRGRRGAAPQRGSSFGAPAKTRDYKSINAGRVEFKSSLRLTLRCVNNFRSSSTAVIHSRRLRSREVSLLEFIN